ncbi:MAG TPA: NAD(P)-dependent oxidoreductase [Vicinamibacterales bacterium]|nr:NAD(P)-dependent oxidoreductase [Vicinamibacterales bacterium]
MTPRVLVTGATGFIGARAVAALASRGAEVHAVVIEPDAIVSGAEAHVADLFDEAAVDVVIDRVRPTTLLHLAWYVEHGKFWTAPQNLSWAARTGTLVRQFAARGGRRVVGAGTCAEYGAAEGTCSEIATPIAPTTIYGQAKAASWFLMQAAAGVAGIEAAWARVFHLFGPGEPEARLVPSIVRPLLAGAPATCRAGAHVRDLIDVADLGDALAAVTLSAATGAVNVGSGTRVELGEVARRLAAMCGREDLLTVEDGRSTPDNPRVLVPDLERLQQDVGWRAPVTLDARLAQVVDWWRAAGHKQVTGR